MVTKEHKTDSKKHKHSKHAQHNAKKEQKSSQKDVSRHEHKEHKRKSHKESTPKASSAKTEKNKGFFSNKQNVFFVAVGALVVIAVVLYLALRSSPTDITPDNGASGNIVASVEGTPIYQSEVDELLSRMPQSGANSSAMEQEAIEQLINKELLSSQASEHGIDVDKEISKIASENNLTTQQLKQAIESQGMTFEEFTEQIAILTYVNETIFSDIEISEDEIERFYNNNSELFRQAERVRARHILISTENRSEDEAQQLAQKTMQEFKDNKTEETFCSLVTQYSEDPGSIQNCGEYPPFSMQDNYVEEYKNTAFANEEDEVSIAKTMFGYHIIWTVEKMPAENLTLEESTQSIKTALMQQKQQQAFDSYLQQLKQEKDIVRCNQEPQHNLCTGNAVATGDNENEESSGNQQELGLEGFAKCLDESGAKMYGAYWCGHCNAQKELFGEAKSEIPYVECSVEGNPSQQTQPCKEKQISGYPTWIIQGEKHPGKLSLERLSSLTGCSL